MGYRGRGGGGGVRVKLFHINKLDVFHKKQCSDPVTMSVYSPILKKDCIVLG